MERTITALKVQKRNPNRVNVYLDGEYAFGLARIVAAWLKVGQSLSESKIAGLQNQDSLESAIQQALRTLGYRPRSEHEIRYNLQKHGFEPGIVDAAIERLRSTGMVQDEAFARTWVEDRSVFRPRSQKMLALELKQKGIAEEVVQQALAQALDDQTLAYEAGKMYARKLHGLSWPDFQKKLSGFLLRRGFSYSVVKDCVQQIWSELQEAAGTS